MAIKIIMTIKSSQWGIMAQSCGPREWDDPHIHTVSCQNLVARSSQCFMNTIQHIHHKAILSRITAASRPQRATAIVWHVRTLKYKIVLSHLTCGTQAMMPLLAFLFHCCARIKVTLRRVAAASRPCMAKAPRLARHDPQVQTCIITLEFSDVRNTDDADTCDVHSSSLLRTH